MAANRLFLVCAHHPNLEDAFCLGERVTNESQYIAPSNRRMDDWFAKHQRCGRGCDHFRLAMHRPADWDVPLPAEQTVPGGVRMALVNGSH